MTWHGHSLAQEAMSQTAVPPTKLTSKWRQIEESWNKMQVGRQGSYSVERLESLDLYCNTTPMTRAIWVCLLTPLPGLAVASTIECLPLRRPSEGWAANWVFWLRLFVQNLVVSFTANTLLAKCVPGLNFPRYKRFIVAFAVSCGFVGAGILAAAKIGFPVPFLMQLSTVPVGIFTPLMLRIVLGPALFDKSSRLKVLGDRFNRNFFATMALILVYPVYKVLYHSVPLNYRGVVVVILPVWKFAAKSLIAATARDLEDYIPELVAFSVDLFGTLFVSVCMYSSRSFYLSGLFIVADIGLSLLEFREIHRNAKVVMEILQNRYTSQVRVKNARRFSGINTNELLETIITVVRNPRAYLIESFDEIRLWSCIPSSIGMEQTNLLLALEASGVYGQVGSAKSPSRHLQSRVVSPVSVAPATALTPDFPTRTGTSDRLAKRSQDLAIQGLYLLFHCEYFTLVQYVECVVPLVYTTFHMVLRQLPNAIFYPTADTDWDGASVANLVVYAVLKVIAFLLLSAFLQKTFSFSPLYQLAFVLESQVAAVQLHVLAALNVLLQYELAHMGAFCNECVRHALYQLTRMTLVCVRCRLHAAIQVASQTK